MRVISGFLKGRILKGDNIKGTKPTMDMIKESLFAIIQNKVKDTICLDLFAGSGSLGIEAISNGAKYAYFVDNNKIACNTIKKNIENFNIQDKTKVFHLDYMKALKYFKSENIKFDLIFLDPPYKDKFISDILMYIDSNDLLYENGQVICEYRDYTLDDSYGNLSSIKERRYGDKTIKIYVKNK